MKLNFYLVINLLQFFFILIVLFEHSLINRVDILHTKVNNLSLLLSSKILPFVKVHIPLFSLYLCKSECERIEKIALIMFPSLIVFKLLLNFCKT